MGAVLTTEPVQRILTDQGFVPGQKLGKKSAGRPADFSRQENNTTVTWTTCRAWKFFLGAIAEQPESIPIKWKTEKPV